MNKEKPIAENKRESISKSASEKLPKDILKEVDENAIEEEKSLEDVEARINESGQDFKEEISNKGIIRSFGEKIAKNKLFRASLVGFSLCGASPTFASEIPKLLDENQNSIEQKEKSESGFDLKSKLEQFKDMPEEYKKQLEQVFSEEVDVREVGAGSLNDNVKIKNEQSENFSEDSKTKKEYRKNIQELRSTNEKYSTSFRDKEHPEWYLKEEAEKTRIKLEKHIGSKDYLEKLKIEFNGDDKMAKEAQGDRLKYLNSAELFFHNSKDLERLLISKAFLPGNFDYPDWLVDGVRYLHDIPEDIHVGGFYDLDNDEVHLSNKEDDALATQHELIHVSMRKDKGISENARKILEDSFREAGTGKEENIYLRDIAERIARKQVLDLELENLGIKRYGEKFTQEHYEKMMKNYHEGHFSRDANEFIETTKQEFRYFEKIFNNIAKNEKGGDNAVEQA
ncbi:MAG: hypothetical protein COX29_02905 [Candidatus Moranbacteria bacterium CG23_combo_of_CG06-09_8_20_14_all_35_22]|nr:MAG: hypothetical protein COX29_02905 [Candidatus Moranbacteria bacterium CG23_combo_of_CG06-09_8_20_14_all_35_22]